MQDSITFVAPTGKAADNLPFKCETIHSAFLLSVRENDVSCLSERKINELKEKFLRTKLLVIEEYSMVGCRLFYKIDHILKIINCNNLSFGGISVLLCGDIGQLLPVNDIPIWANINDCDDSIITESKKLFRLFNVNFTLTEVMRQLREDQQRFRDLLGRVRLGEILREDFELLKSKFISRNCRVILVYNNAQKEAINEKKLSELASDVFS